ncbi:Sigma-W factor [Anaerohalosphaera lusitana]|uniref:Sigma-W factor n=1 Tax=Anaerohalosphaera lusitana TaxID=1936003 RepID=A0A1U9NP13_9BACT|nr:RNA polymerase sigma factor [Anaerohalosphaera lusitana]AQT69653.1 Sigma-W factor [Anaerohalosphaera lusitana]
MTTRKDEKLVLACKQGDRDAYGQLVERHYKRVFSVCMGLTGDVHDAEDIAQDAMVKAFTRIESLEDGGQFGSWVVRVARNLCIDFFRRRTRGREIVAEQAEGLKKSGADSEKNAVDLEGAIKMLPQENRLPLMLYYFENKSPKHIAKELGISDSGVYRRLRHARQELHAILTQEGESV